MMVFMRIDFLTSIVRWTIVAGRVTSNFLTVGVQVTCFFLGLGTVGWDGACATPVGSFMASTVMTIGVNMVEP